MPVLLMHGKRDNIIPENIARRSYNKLLEDEFLVEYKTIEGLGHGASIGSLGQISDWLEERY